jgi:hypothetical protein
VPTYAVIISRRAVDPASAPSAGELAQLAIGLTDHGAAVSEISDGTDWSVLLSVDAPSIAAAPAQAHQAFDQVLERVGVVGSETYAIEAMTIAEQQRLLSDPDRPA